MDSQQMPASNEAPSQFAQTSQPKGVNKILVVAVAVVVGILIIGGGAFAYITYFPSPEKVIQKMAVKLADVKTLEYTGEVKAEVTMEDFLGEVGGLAEQDQTAADQKTSNFTFNFTGSSDIQNLASPKSLFLFNITTDVLPQGESAFGLEVRSIDKISYLKISNVPMLGFFDLSFLNDQWIKIDQKAIKEQLGLDKLEEQIKEAQKTQELTPDQIARLKTAIVNSKIVNITAKLPSEMIGGVNTFHYKIAVDKSKIKNLYAESSLIIQNKALTEKEVADFDKAIEKLESLNGEIWIGKADYLPYKISLSSKIKETDDTDTSGKIDMTVSFRNFNKPVQIEIPAPVKTVEEIIGELFGGMVVPTPPTETPSLIQPSDDDVPDTNFLDSTLDIDQDGLSDREEVIFGTDINNPDTDGDGYTDGDEVAAGYNPNGPGLLE